MDLVPKIGLLLGTVESGAARYSKISEVQPIQPDTAKCSKVQRFRVAALPIWMRMPSLPQRYVGDCFHLGLRSVPGQAAAQLLHLPLCCGMPTTH